MTYEGRLKDIIETMIAWNMLDPTRLYDSDYVAERVTSYILCSMILLMVIMGGH